MVISYKIEALIGFDIFEFIPYIIAIIIIAIIAYLFWPEKEESYHHTDAQKIPHPESKPQN